MTPALALPQLPGRPTARAILRERLLGMIASGLLTEGDELPGERVLATSLGVSRETVRAAIGDLASEGFLVVAQGARTRVAPGAARPDGASRAAQRIGLSAAGTINGYTLEDLHRSRMLVEEQVVREAALAIDAATLSRLETSLGLQRDMTEDPLAFLIADRAFHLALYAACPNRLLGDLAGDLHAAMMDRRRRAMARPGAIARSLTEHRAILDALAARDPDAVATAVGRHSTRIHQTTLAPEGEDARPVP